jgi:hypothetical protein
MLAHHIIAMIAIEKIQWWVSKYQENVDIAASITRNKISCRIVERLGTRAPRRW